MTHIEVKKLVFKITESLVKNGGYIKWYKPQYRLCDAAHNPVLNMSKGVKDVLIHNKIIIQQGLIFVSAVKESPFKSHLDVELIL